ncbi:ScbA/BarX family gamma-butyrolactone biosynthesis protein [Kitasatospora sp. NPDC002227]|uniref:ScbA/BarX family gamma-butyrolactone biosynthesis protein n=1 Tax=Kitasatospora sp. NPDC002227 TaxID=3154773 RepID=UPI003321F414
MTSVLSDTIGLLTAERPAGSDVELHQQTVPRRYVHRASVSEVLLTGWQRTAPDQFLLGAQWPRTHSFYRPVAWVYDPLLLAETVRQAGLLVAHVGYNVPLDFPFVMWDLSYQAVPEQMVVNWCPADLTVEVTCDPRFRRGALAGMTYHVDIYRGTERLGGGSAKFDCMAPATYARIRAPFLADAPSFRFPQQAVSGDDTISNTVITPTEVPNRWLVQADRRHPVLFDHAVDHVPGMVLVEAMRQAAAAVAEGQSLAPFGLDCLFTRYAELHLPVYVRAGLGPVGEGQDRTVGVVLEQAGQPVAKGILQLRPLPADACA